MGDESCAAGRLAPDRHRALGRPDARGPRTARGALRDRGELVDVAELRVLGRVVGAEPIRTAVAPRAGRRLRRHAAPSVRVTADADRYLSGDASFIYRTLQHEPEDVPGGGGNFWIIDSRNFPAAKTIAATFVTLKPGGLRELHWHPNVSRQTLSPSPGIPRLTRCT